MKLLSLDGESGGFKYAFHDLADSVRVYSEIQGLLVPLLMAPRMDHAAYLLRVMQLMDMRHRIVIIQRETYVVMLEASQIEENRPMLAQAIHTLDHTIACYLEGCRQCPSFLN